MSIVILAPSRGRPDRAAVMAESVAATAPDVDVILVVDQDDPELAGYAAVPVELIVLPERVGYTASLNTAAAAVVDEHDVIGAFGDDVIFRTPGWDQRVAETLATPGIAYGDDLIHGVNHPSAVFMSTTIVRALGWLALPATRHQWADDGWKRLGQRTGLLRFMPDVVIEHMHPAVGKAAFDATYGWNLDGSPEANARAAADHDGFMAWVDGGGLDADVERVLAAVR